MKTVVLIGILIAAIGFAFRATLARCEKEAALVALATTRDDLREKISRARQQFEAAQQARNAVPAVEVSAVAQGGKDPAANEPAPRKASVDAVIANDPKRMAETLKQFREIVGYHRAAMFKALGFSREQIEKWKDLGVQMEQRRMDLVASAEVQGLTPKSEAFKTLAAENERFRQTKEAEILGDLEPAYREYERTEPVRSSYLGGAGVTWLTVVGLYSGEAIAPAQVERTTQILAANSERIESGPHAGWVKENTVNWATAMPQLKEVISPAQIVALRAISDQVAKNRAIDQTLSQRAATLAAQFKGQPVK